MKENTHNRATGHSFSCRVLYLLLLTQFFLLSSVLSQTIPIKGTVTDTKGNPIKGVTVNIKGTAVGTTTSDSGTFKMNAPGPQSVLVFSLVGHANKEETVGTKATFNISMSEKNNSLDEVVVIGYGQTMRKGDLGGAVSSVNAKQIAERQPINLFDALQGQAAGVLIMNDNGEPGAQGSIQIRGANTFASEGNSPLYVIDGVISDNAAALNPNDIERVEVLKDAASASIYGARSAAGVILITTKKGKDGKSRVDLQYSKIYGWLAHKIQVANASELRLYRKIQNGNLSGGSGNLTDSLNPAFNTDNDLQEMLLGNTADRNDMKMSVSGWAEGDQLLW